MDGQDPRVIDSTASDHIFGNSSLFTSQSPPKIPHLITLANGTKVTSKGFGKFSIFPSLNLDPIHFVPNCPFNLVSLSQLTKALNFSITFDADSFVIQERDTSWLIGVEHESRGLYYLEISSSMSCFATPSPKLLHNHLGHPHLLKLKMVPSLNKLQVLECESCQLGQHVRFFPKRTETRCSSVFSTIPSDIWGPSCVTSFGFRYFVTFIDEYSKCTWVYLMKDQSELLSIFMSFFNEIKTQFGKVINILNSDNANTYYGYKDRN